MATFTRVYRMASLSTHVCHSCRKSKIGTDIVFLGRSLRGFQRNLMKIDYSRTILDFYRDWSVSVHCLIFVRSSPPCIYVGIKSVSRIGDVMPGVQERSQNIWFRAWRLFSLMPTVLKWTATRVPRILGDVRSLVENRWCTEVMSACWPGQWLRSHAEPHAVIMVCMSPEAAVFLS